MTEAAHSRYQFKPFPGSSHSWALQQLAHVNATSTVLDIGPGSGSIGQHLKEAAKPAYLAAVEIDPATIAELNGRSIYNVIVTDIQELSGQTFDYILLLDVLEHVPQPEKFLAQSLAALKPGGCLLISVPNIAHWSIRISLLFGFFEYTERGLLDKTHLHFFTRRRFRQICKISATCQLELEGSSIEPAEFVLPQWLVNSAPYRALRRIHLACAQVIPGLLAYQHLGCIRNSK